MKIIKEKKINAIIELKEYYFMEQKLIVQLVFYQLNFLMQVMSIKLEKEYILMIH